MTALASLPAGAGARRRPVPRRGVVDRWFLLFVLAVPLVPRPTLEGPAALLAPVALAGLLYVVVLWLLREQPRDHGGGRHVVRLTVLCAASLAPYAVTVAAAPSAGELERLAARALMYAGSLALLWWMVSRRVTPLEVLGRLFHGYLAVAALVVVVGITGTSPFEPPAPARDYGFVLPFAKTSGIPRSFGELALIASAAWAYLLVAGDRLRPPVRLAGWVLVPLSVAVSQSRTAYLAFAAVALAHLACTRLRSRWVGRALLVACLAGPLASSLVFPVIEDQPIARSLVGEGYLHDNLTERISLVGTAGDLLAADPLRSLAGYPRSAWEERTAPPNGEPVALHNHFVASLVFLGVLGGGVVLVGLYVAPTLRIVRAGLSSPSSLVVFLAVVGALVSLGSYEGYFSLAFMVVLAVLWRQAYAADVAPAVAR